MSDCEEITRAQQRIGRLPTTPRTRTDYRRVARWWELEARRGYPSAESSRTYARNMRWAAERVLCDGRPGTWREIVSRAAEQGGTP